MNYHVISWFQVCWWKYSGIKHSHDILAERKVTIIMIERKTLFEDLQVLRKYYDFVKIVDPLVMKTVRLNDILMPSTCLQYDSEPCFCFYHHGDKCENCIALQATQLNDTFVKIERLEGNFVMVIAMPVNLDGYTVALELIKRVNYKALENLLDESRDGSGSYSALIRLNELAITDGLTHLYNRRYINEKLPVAMAHARLHKRPLSIVMADIDFFKRVNDQCGHGVGDGVLKAFAAQLKKNIRQNSGDWVARYGGEEFLIILANCSENQAYKIAEKLRNNIEQAVIPTSAGPLKITASFGVYTFCGQESDIQQLLDKADKQLYQAKQAGRNCTISVSRQKSPSG